MRRKSLAGFTLIEVLVALVLSGLVAVGVHDVFATMSRAASQTSAASRALDTDATKARLLRGLVADMETTGSLDTEFGGDSVRAEFTSWCLTSHGWGERCRVVFALEEVNRVTTLRVHFGEDSVSLQTVSSESRLLYLTDLSAGGGWSPRWNRGPLLPRAIGLLSPHDTVIMRIGGRG